MITDAYLVDQTFQAFVVGDAQFPQIIGIDDIIAAIILGAIGTAVAWMVQRCLNHTFDDDRARRLARWAIKKTCNELPQAIATHTDGDEFDGLYGDRMTRALKTTYGRTDVAQLRAERAPHFLGAGAPALAELPEGA